MDEGTTHRYEGLMDFGSPFTEVLPFAYHAKGGQRDNLLGTTDAARERHNCRRTPHEIRLRPPHPQAHAHDSLTRGSRTV